MNWERGTATSWHTKLSKLCFIFSDIIYNELVKEVFMRIDDCNICYVNGTYFN